MQAAGHREEVTSLYRAVAKAELDDIAQAGFRQHPNSLSLESKLFATSPEDAARFGRDNFRFDEVLFHIIESATSGKAGGLKKVEPLKAVRVGAAYRRPLLPQVHLV